MEERDKRNVEGGKIEWRSAGRERERGEGRSGGVTVTVLLLKVSGIVPGINSVPTN